MTASEIQQQNYQRQWKQYQDQVQQYQQQWMQYQQQILLAQQLAQQYPQHIQTVPQMQMPVGYYPQAYQPPVQTVPYPGQQQQQHSRPQKKFQKKQKAQKPNILKSCVACEKDFTSAQQYEIHMQQHIKCQYCDYEAHYKIVQKHQEMAHQGNYTIPSLDTEEDIAKWIEERKRNFPTRARIVEKGEPESKKRKAESSDSYSESEEEEEEIKRPCKFYAKGKCKKGDACPFLHDESIVQIQASSTPKPPPPVTHARKNLYEMVFMINKLTKPDEQKQKLYNAIKFIVDNRFLN